MSRHFATLLAATAIAACSSNPNSIEAPAASAPYAQDFPAPLEPMPEPYEEALAPEAPLVLDIPPELRAPDHVLPPRGDSRPMRASSCDVIVSRTRNGVKLTAVADVDRSISGDYSFVITKSGGGNSSDIEQGGPFKSSGARSVELSSSEISVERGSSWRATLRLMSRGREVCRQTVRS